MTDPNPQQQDANREDLRNAILDTLLDALDERKRAQRQTAQMTDRTPPPEPLSSTVIISSGVTLQHGLDKARCQ